MRKGEELGLFDLIKKKGGHLQAMMLVF